MTFSPNVMHLIREFITSVPETTFGFVGLDISFDRIYRLYVEVKNTSGNNTPLYNILFNGDATLTNYWSQVTRSSGSSVFTGRTNAPRIEEQALTNNSTFSSVIDIEMNVDNKACYNCITRIFDAGSIQTETISGQYTIAGNVTQVGVNSSVVGAIGTGSTLRLFRISTI